MRISLQGSPKTSLIILTIVQNLTSLLSLDGDIVKKTRKQEREDKRRKRGTSLLKKVFFVMLH